MIFCEWYPERDFCFSWICCFLLHFTPERYIRTHNKRGRQWYSRSKNAERGSRVSECETEITRFRIQRQSCNKHVTIIAYKTNYEWRVLSELKIPYFRRFNLTSLCCCWDRFPLSLYMISFFALWNGEIKFILICRIIYVNID